MVRGDILSPEVATAISKTLGDPLTCPHGNPIPGNVPDDYTEEDLRSVLTPMALGVFDVYQSTEQRGKLQDAMDAAALYAAKSNATDTPGVNTIGNKVLGANLQMVKGARLESSGFTLGTVNGDTVIQGQASVSLPAYAPMAYLHQPVTVTAQATNTTREATSDDSGHYVVPLLGVADFTIRIEGAGFKPSEAKDVRLQIDEHRELDFKLAPASVSTSVDVNATEVAVQTSNPTLGEVITSQEVAELPEDFWVLPDGRMLRIARQRHPNGGLLMIFSDITNEVALKSQYDALLQTQKAALDKLHEAVVVFGLDGRLKLSNHAFEEMWTLDVVQLEDDKPFEKVVELIGKADTCEEESELGEWRWTRQDRRDRQAGRGRARRLPGSGRSIGGIRLLSVSIAGTRRFAVTAAPGGFDRLDELLLSLGDVVGPVGRHPQFA